MFSTTCKQMFANLKSKVGFHVQETLGVLFVCNNVKLFIMKNVDDTNGKGKIENMQQV